VVRFLRTGKLLSSTAALQTSPATIITVSLIYVLEQKFIDVPLPEGTDPSGRPYGASIAADGSKLVFSYGFDENGSEIHLFDINTNLTKVITNKNSSDQ